MQNHVISEKKRVTFGVLFCVETLYVLVNILSRFSQDSMRKTYNLFDGNAIQWSESDIL